MSTLLKAVDYRAPNAAEQFVASLRETGFGVLSNHPITTKALRMDFFLRGFPKPQRALPKKTSKSTFIIMRGDNARQTCALN